MTKSGLWPSNTATKGDPLLPQSIMLQPIIPQSIIPLMIVLQTYTGIVLLLRKESRWGNRSSGWEVIGYSSQVADNAEYIHSCCILSHIQINIACSHILTTIAKLFDVAVADEAFAGIRALRINIYVRSKIRATFAEQGKSCDVVLHLPLLCSKPLTPDFQGSFKCARYDWPIRLEMESFCPSAHAEQGVRQGA